MNSVRYFSFMQNEKGLSGENPFPVCGITCLSCGSMKPARDNGNRERVFRRLGLPPESVLALNQTHSRIVHVADSPSVLSCFSEGDGMISRNRDLVLSVSVADCMPVYIFDPVSGCFGVLHSGWRGTGIIRSAFELAFDEWGADPSGFHVLFGPHIRSCCYTVDAERAEYFARTFGPSCVSLDTERESRLDNWPYRLSLAEANRLLCVSLGVKENHIVDTNECTSCNGEFGSCRREGPGKFTNMAAFIHRID